MRDFSCLTSIKPGEASGLILDASLAIKEGVQHQSVNTKFNTRVDLSRIVGGHEYQATLRSPSGAILAVAIV